MGSGISGLYLGTLGSIAVPASLDVMEKSDDFSVNISKRKDVDVNGYLDVIAHGCSSFVRLCDVNGTHNINHRQLARLIKNRPDYQRKGIRLFSCETGKGNYPIAQKLADKLGVPVKAPSELCWADENGRYFVAKRIESLGRSKPDLQKRGRFVTFYPGGKGRK